MNGIFDKVSGGKEIYKFNYNSTPFGRSWIDVVSGQTLMSAKGVFGKNTVEVSINILYRLFHPRGSGQITSTLWRIEKSITQTNNFLTGHLTISDYSRGDSYRLDLGTLTIGGETRCEKTLEFNGVEYRFKFIYAASLNKTLNIDIYHQEHRLCNAYFGGVSHLEIFKCPIVINVSDMFGLVAAVHSLFF